MLYLTRSLPRNVLRRPHVALLLTCLLAMLTCSKSQAMHVSQNGDYVMVVDATVEEYSELINELWGVYYPTWMNLDWFEWDQDADWLPAGQDPNTDYPDAYFGVNAIFKKNTEGYPVRHYYNISQAEMEQHMQECQELGYDVVQIEAYESPWGVLFGYIAYKRPGPAWAAFIGLTEAGFDILAGDLEPGMQWVNYCLTDDLEGDLRQTALFKKDGAASYVPPEALTFAELGELYATLAPAGYALDSLEVLQPNLFVPVFKITDTGQFLPEAEAYMQQPGVTASLNANEMAGMRPVLISAVNNTSASTYALWREFPRPRRRPTTDDDLKPATRQTEDENHAIRN